MTSYAFNNKDATEINNYSHQPRTELNIKIYSFNFSPDPNNSLTLTKTLASLENLTKQDILMWTKEFKETCNQCSWTNTLAINVLQSIINPSLYEKIPVKLTDYNKKLDFLIKISFPENDSTLYRSLIKNITERF
ncbi:hypothetical protein DMUE_2556 [Dictyocoela muelleri]|nr:hypothetical protein DMUE_2556 [Dictyocoela muelleri]